jgi:CRISPR-associated protein Csd1
MLAQLVEYARHKQLVAEPGFAAKEIRWLANISRDGRFVGVTSLEDGKRGRMFACCPDLQQPEMIAMPGALGVSQAAHFLADTCGVIAGVRSLDKDGQTKTDTKSLEDTEKNVRKQVTFKLLIAKAAVNVPDLEPIRTVLDSTESLQALRDELEERKAKPTDKLSFQVSGTLILDSDSWHDWWRAFRRQNFGKSASAEPEGAPVTLQPSSSESMLSLASAQPVIPASTHPKLTKLGVGSMATGASLVGFDKDAFTSFGLEQGQNAAVSEDTASAYRAALDAMLERAPVLGQMKIAFWYDHDPPEELDSFASLFEPNLAGNESSALERARAVYNAVRTGAHQARIGGSHYYALSLSGAAGRAMVRDWHTGTLEDFTRAVTIWFEDLEITKASGAGSANPPGLNRALMSLQRPKGRETQLDDYLKPVRMLQLPLWRAALEPNAPIPFAAVAKIMETHRSEVVTGDFEAAIRSKSGPDETGAMLGRVYARMAILKAYHRRKARTQGGHLMISSLDPNHPSKAYHCGRLMYLLANVQEVALGSDLNAGVVQRYYGAASSTPALVLGRLTRLSQAHLGKISGDKPGLAFHLEKQIAAVWNALGKELPKTLTLEEQSLFALGYYQQLAFRPEKTEAPLSETTS